MKREKTNYAPKGNANLGESQFGEEGEHSKMFPREMKRKLGQSVEMELPTLL